MKIAYFLALSVGLTACLPVLAANDAQSDKADWIKQSLGNVEAKPKSNLVEKKLCLSQPTASKSSNVKLRAFVPNRYLPREKDLQLAYERGRYDRSQADPYIRGNISAFNEESPYSVKQQYASPSYPKPAAVNIAQEIGQTIKSALKNEKSTKDLIKTYRPNAFRSSQFAEPPELTTKIMPESLMNTRVEPYLASAKNKVNWQELSKKLPIVNPPSLSEEERSQLNYLVDMNMPKAGDTGVVPEVAMDSAGPAPFPLNLLPMNAMQNLEGSRKFNKKPQITARFGSWHNKEMLPQGSFQSYAPAPRQYFLSHVPATYAAAKPAIRSGYKNSKAKNNLGKRVASNYQNSQNSQPLTVAVYPPYKGQGAVYTF